MRRLGSILLTAGAAVGAGVGIAMLGGFHIASLPWLVSVGLTKLTLLASGSLMGAGAVCLRLDRRERERRSLTQSRDEDRPRSS